MSGSTLTPAQYLAFLAPEFAAIDPAIIASALAIAATKVPIQLPASLYGEAIAMYSAWLLAIRSGGYGDGTGSSIAGSLVLMEREGDLQKQYAKLSDLGLTAADIGNYKSRYDAIVKAFFAGSLITRYG